MLVKKDLWGNVINKVKQSIERLQHYEPREGYHLAYSGGKDSDVILSLAKRSGVKFDAHYQLTTVDPPELVNYIRNNHPEVNIELPKETMWQLIPRKKMPPTRIVRYCCEVLKERGGIGRTVVTGVRWAESNSRSKRKMTEICFKDKSKTYLHPIIDWTESDVWSYIKQNDVDYCKLYDKGFSRLGCIGCPLIGATGMKRDFKRWPKYKESYIRAFDRMLEVRKERGLKTNWNSGKEVMEWWINGGCNERTAEGQEKLILMDN